MMFKPKLRKMPFLLTSLTAVMVALPMAASAGPGPAQGGGSPTTDSMLVAQSSEQQAAEFSEEQLETFVEARQRVIEISKKWQDRLNNADSQEELTSAQQAAQEEMVDAVKDQGLSVDDYNLIADAAQQDPELMDRLNEMISQ